MERLQKNARFMQGVFRYLLAHQRESGSVALNVPQYPKVLFYFLCCATIFARMHALQSWPPYGRSGRFDDFEEFFASTLVMRGMPARANPQVAQ